MRTSRERWACLCSRWKSNSARVRWKPCSTPPTCSPQPTRWCCSATVCARRCAARATFATFMCRPRRFRTSCPAAGTCTSRWWTTRAAEMPACATPRHPAAPALDAQHHALLTLAPTWLAGLLAHARGMTALCTPTINGFCPLPPECTRTPARGLGTRQPWRHAARGGRGRRPGHPHRKPGGRARSEPLPLHGSADPRRTRWPDPRLGARARLRSTLWRCGRKQFPTTWATP